jgi:hypothetical protein
VQWSTEELEEDHPRMAAGRSDGLAQPWGSQNRQRDNGRTKVQRQRLDWTARELARARTVPPAGGGARAEPAGAAGWTCRLEGHVLAAHDQRRGLAEHRLIAHWRGRGVRVRGVRRDAPCWSVGAVSTQRWHTLELDRSGHHGAKNTGKIALTW